MTEKFTLSEIREKKNLIDNLYYISRYPVHIFKDDQLVYSSADIDRNDTYKAEDPFLCDANIFKSLVTSARATPSIEAEEADIFYGLLHCFTNTLCVIGPLASKKPDIRQTHAYMRRHHMLDFQNYTIHTGSPAQTLSILQLLNFILTGHNNGSEPSAGTRLFHFDQLPDAPQEQQDFLLQSYKLSHNEDTTDHVPFKMEEMMMSCIREGDYDKLKKMFSTSSNNYSSGTMAHSPLKQTEYGAVIGVSLMSRAAIAGGVNPYDAYDMNDMYLQKIAAVSSEKEYNKIFESSFLGYINAVRKVKAQQSQSVHIEKCKTYISRHLNKPFTREDLAKYTDLNPAYLSHLFVQHEHQTLKCYILRERVSAAMNMLKFSDYSISQIAEYLCFGTQSRFGATFKRFAGMTPAEYRRQNQYLG